MTEVPKIFNKYGSYSKAIEDWFKNCRPLFRTKLSDIPDSEVKKSIQFYVAHHLRKIKKECGICPSRRLLEHSDQGMFYYI